LLTLLVFRWINLANATPEELEQLTQACEVFDEANCKAGEMDSEFFSSSLDPFRANLIEIIRGYLLEGEESTKNMEIEAYKLNIYSAH
jgi:peptide subunit release factor RF-3